MILHDSALLNPVIGGVILGTLLVWVISHRLGKKSQSSVSKQRGILGHKGINQPIVENSLNQYIVKKNYVQTLPFEIIINVNKCNGCFACIDVCPVGVFDAFNKKAVVKYPEKCLLCLACEVECPTRALQIIEHAQRN